MDKPSPLQMRRPWLRAVFGIVGILIFSLYIVWDADNESMPTLTQEKKTENLHNLGNLSPQPTGLDQELLTTVRKLQQLQDRD